MMLTPRTVLAGCLAAGLLAALAAPATAEELKVTFAAPNAIYWDTDVAIDKGFFKEQGFDVKRVALVTSVAAASLVILASALTYVFGGRVYRRAWLRLHEDYVVRPANG